MADLEKDIAQLLREYQARTGKPIMIGTVESASGGRICDRITNVPGSSDYYKGSIVAYNNEVKMDIVGVDDETIANHGTVSPMTAIEMAEGGRKLLNVDICLSDTGIAGPAGATTGKPVGLFYIGLSAEGTTLSREHRFRGSRERNKERATEMSLSLLKEYLQTCLSKISDATLEEKHVVTCFLEHGGKILILRRSGKVGTYRRSWAGVSGYMEISDLEQAFTEISEETELYKKDLKLVKKGEPLDVVDRNLNQKWVVHPFLFHVKAPEKIKLDWEHTEMKWIKPRELTKYSTVPGLKEALNRVIK